MQPNNSLKYLKANTTVDLENLQNIHLTPKISKYGSESSRGNA